MPRRASRPDSADATCETVALLLMGFRRSGRSRDNARNSPAQEPVRARPAGFEFGLRVTGAGRFLPSPVLSLSSSSFIGQSEAAAGDDSFHRFNERPSANRLFQIFGADLLCAPGDARVTLARDQDDGNAKVT